MAKTKKSAPGTIAENRKARYNYSIDETFEAGIVLEGWEVKSIRAGRAQLNESHVIFRRGEAWLIGANISPLNTVSTHITPDPTRTRKLLLHRKELNKLLGSVERKGFTVVPLTLYWKQNHIKLNIGLVQGKKKYDKRASIKERDWQRDKARILKTKR